MSRTKITLRSQHVLDAGEHEAIVEGGILYVALISGLPAGEAEASKSTNTAQQIADDTKQTVAAVTQQPAATKGAASKTAATKGTSAVNKGAASKRAPEPEVTDDAAGGGEDEYVTIPPEQWGTLNAGDMALVKLGGATGADADKLWEVQIVGMQKPKGSTQEKLYVKFTEDDTEDYLRAGDEMFEYKVIV